MTIAQAVQALSTEELLSHCELYDDEEGFAERAMRTRPGSRLNPFGPSCYAEFRLGEPLHPEAVVLTVITDLLDPTTRTLSPLARDVVYNTLRRESPCESDETE